MEEINETPRWNRRPGFLRATKIVLGIGIGLAAALFLLNLPFTLSAILATAKNGFGSIAASAEMGMILYVMMHMIWAVLMVGLLAPTIFSILSQGRPFALCIPFWILFALDLTQFVTQVTLIYA